MTEEPKTPREFEFHPLAELFPMLDKESRSFKGLVEDIKANRQYEPIWLLEGKILDGRNRYNACQHLGKEVVARDYVGNDPIGFVLSVNLHRRHLNTSQRAMVAAKLATFTHGGDRSKAPIGGLTDAEAAKLLNVGERSVERARQVLAKGDPSLIDAVEQGETSVTDAAATATKAQHRRRRSQRRVHPTSTTTPRRS
jgi:ParB-like chromosome segregation protein Spo0J